jgi:hypothetical protein
MTQHETSDAPLLVVHWSRNARIFALAGCLFGCGIFAVYGIKQMQGKPQPMPLWQLAIGCALVPIGLGIFVATFQRTYLYPDRIEVRFFEGKRCLDIATTRVAKMESNGYTLKDGQGKKVFIHKQMVNSQELLRRFG